MSLYENERFNFVRLCCILEKVHAMLILLFHQCYSKKVNGKEWSESFGTTFHNQDKFSKRYREDQRKCIKSGQVEDWDISLLCDILLNSSYFFLVDPPLRLEVQCEFEGCKAKDCKHNQHGSNILKLKSPADSAKLSGLATLLRPESKQLHKLTFVNAFDMGIVVQEKLLPNEYTIYPCSKKWVAVDQLRDIRNNFAHMNFYKISEQDLIDKAKKVKKAYEAFDEETSEIDAIMSEHVLDPKQWQMVWEKYTEDIEQLKANFKADKIEVYIKFNDLKEDFFKFKEDTERQLTSMKEGISEFKEDTGRQLTSMKEDISELKSKVTNQEHIHDSKTQKKATSSQFKEGLPLVASTTSTSSSNTSISSMDASHPMSNVSHPTPSFSSSYNSIPISPHGHYPSLYESDHISRDVGKVLCPLVPSASPPKQEFVRVGTGHQPLQQPNSQMNICPPQGRTTFWIAGNEPPNLSQQIPLPTSQALPLYTFQAPPPIFRAPPPITSLAPLPTTQKLLLGSKGLELLRRHSLSERDLTIKCGDDLFHELSNKAVHNPHTLALRLGLGRVDIEQIERDYKSDYKRQITQIFWKWRERNGKDATFLLLIDAFIEEENIEAAEIVLDFFKNHRQTVSKCFSWSNGQFESRQKSGVASDSYRRHSFQEVQKRPQSYSSQMETHGKPYRTTFENKKGQLQHNNDFSQSFDFFFDDIVAVISGDKKLFHDVVEAITSHFLTHPIEREKALRNSLSVIGCKTIITDVWTFINRARNPERALQRLLLILRKFDQLEHIANYIEAKALETRKCTLLGTVLVTKKKEVQDQTLFVVHDNTEVADTSIAAAVSDSAIQRYAKKLKGIYLNKLSADDKWSPAKDRNFLEFIDLVVVSLQSRSKDEVSRIPLADLFKVPCGSSLLIEGVPGIGKSTLAYEMCKRWANGSALQNYSLVLLLRLRDDDVQRYWSPDMLEELVGRYLTKQSQSWKSQVIQEIIDNDGEGLLVILEGFDELPENKQLELDVLEHIMYSLSEATIIITTRTSTAHDLAERFQFKKHIEIRGFNECSQSQYIKAFFGNDTARQESFKKYMDRYPIISGCLHIPLILAYLLKIFVSPVPSELPQTMTELYQSLIKMYICGKLRSQAPPGTQISIPSLRELPDATTQEAFRIICLLAYESIFTHNKQKLVFYKPEKYETLGLMQREPKFLQSKGGDTYAYSFLHLTIQEFLGAYHIYCLSPQEIHHHLNKFQHNYKMSVTMRFLAGLTEFQGRNITIPDGNISSLDIFHQLMETKKDALVSQIFNEHQKFKVARIPTVITEQDFYVLGRCIALSSCNWRFGFTLRAITDKHMNMFVSGFNSVSGTALSSKKCPRLEGIGLSLNPLGSKGVISMLSLPSFILNTISEFNLRATTLDKECLKHCIAMLQYFSNLKMMLFHDNSFKEGEQQPLIDVLCTLQNLEKVSFSNLGPAECVSVLMGSQSIREVELYELSPSSIEAVFITLSRCRTLECIEIYQSQITKEIAEKALTQSHPFPFQTLKLINCAIDSDTACVIVDAVTHSPTLQTLDLSDNIIDDIGGRHIADKIGFITAKSLPLSEIFLHHNSFSGATIYCLIDQLAWCPLDLSIYLSLQWRVVINEYVHQCPFKDGALKHFKFERPNPHT